MAGADYRHCDVCGGKAFYDAELSYEDGPSEYNTSPPYRVGGDDQYDTPEKNDKWGMRLGYVLDWAVICTDCTGWRTRIERIAPSGDAEYTSWFVKGGQS